MKPIDILKEYWGYDSFRPRQEEIVNAALEGKDVLAILPTGGGKSVCFQVPAMIREGIALVVTPSGYDKGRNRPCRDTSDRLDEGSGAESQ